MRRSDGLPWKGAAAYYGLEANADQIYSTNLGDHGRNRGAGYADFELKGKRWGTVSAGMREEIFSGGRSVAIPSAAVSFWVQKKVKLRASVERGFRLPTYVDLYYSDPSTIGNPNLKPESVWNFDAGADWYLSSRLTFTATVFHSSQTDAIDYVRANASDPWQAENLNGVHFTGVDAEMDWRPVAGQEFRLGADDAGRSAGGVAWVAVGVCVQLSGAECCGGVDRAVQEWASAAAEAACREPRG